MASATCSQRCSSCQNAAQHSLTAPPRLGRSGFQQQRASRQLPLQQRQRPAGITASLAGAAMLSAPVAVSGFSAVGGSSSSSMIASVIGVSLAALLYMKTMRVEQTDGNLPECPRCEGTGYTDCVCTRWSDGDFGCSTCRGTGKAVCPSCGGGGRATPIRQEVHVRANE